MSQPSHPALQSASWRRIRLPVSAKIVVWFFLNLILLGLVALVIVRVHFQLGLSSLLSGRAGERLQSMSEVVVADLREHARSEWSAQLARFASAYEVQLAVFSSDGKQVAGKIAKPPPMVMEKLTTPPRPGDRPNRFRDPAPDRPRPPRDRQGREPDGPMRPPGRESPETAPDERPVGWGHDQPGEERGLRGTRRDRALLPPPPDSRPSNYPKFILHSKSPPLYWVGAYVPLPQTRPAGPMVLLIASKSLSINGLLFDFTPWFLLGIGILINIYRHGLNDQEAQKNTTVLRARTRQPRIVRL